MASTLYCRKASITMIIIIIIIIKGRRNKKIGMNFQYGVVPGIIIAVLIAE